MKTRSGSPSRFRGTASVETKYFFLWNTDLTLILDNVTLSPITNFGCAAERENRGNAWKEMLEHEKNILGD